MNRVFVRGDAELCFLSHHSSALPLRHFGIAINLISRGAQTGNAVAVDVALPGEELIDRDVVKCTGLFDRYPPPRTASITAALRRTVQRWLAFGSSGTGPSASSQSGSFAPLSPGCGGNTSSVAVGISLTLYRCSQIPMPAMTAMKTAAVPAVRTNAIPSDVKPSIPRR